MQASSSPIPGRRPRSTTPATCNTATISAARTSKSSASAGGSHDLSSTVINYQFAISRGHNFGGQDFATTYFNGPSNVTFGLNQTDPYRPKLSPLDGTNINDATAYTIASTTIPDYHSTQLNYQGEASVARRYSVGSHYGVFETGFKVRDAHKSQAENDQFYNATDTITMDRLVGPYTAPNYYDGTFTVGPLTDYNKIKRLLATSLQSGFTPNTDRNQIVSNGATWDTTERVYAGVPDELDFVGQGALGGRHPI